MKKFIEERPEGDVCEAYRKAVGLKK